MKILLGSFFSISTAYSEDNANVLTNASIKPIAMYYMHCVKRLRIRSYSGPHFPAFGLNTERYVISLRIQSKCGKSLTRITPNTDTFYRALWTSPMYYVNVLQEISSYLHLSNHSPIILHHNITISFH